MNKKLTNTKLGNIARKAEIKEIFLKEVENNDCKIIGEYTSIRHNVLLLCKNGHEFSIRPDHFRSAIKSYGCGCATCYKKLLKQSEKARNDFYEIAKNKNCQVKGEYENPNNKVLLTCPNGHDFTISPKNFRKAIGCGCPKCPKPKSIHSKEKFFKLIDKIDYKVCEEYIDADTKILMRCNNNHEFYMKPYVLTNNARCAKCCHIKIKSKTELKLHEKANEIGYKINERYTDPKQKISITCNMGHTFFMVSGCFLNNNRRCSKCAGNCPEQGKDKFLEKSKEKGCQVIGNYQGVRSKIKMLCPLNHEFSIKPNTFMNIKNDKICGCVHCSGNQQKKEKAFEELLIQANKDNYEIINKKYIDAHTKLLFKCDHGHEFNMKPNSFKNGTRCPHCASNSFQSTRPAYIYVFDLENDGNKVIGFGISNVPKTRFKQHKTTFNKTNTKNMLLGVFYFENGYDVQKIELDLKQGQYSTTFPIKGFKKECLIYEKKDWLLEKLAKTGKLVDIVF
jgi:hypothetical protein